MAKLTELIAETMGSAHKVRNELIGLAVLAIAGIVLLFQDTALNIVNTWYASNAYNHGFLIIPICLYLAYRQQAEAAGVEIRPDLRGVVLVFLAGLIWLIGHLAGALVVEEFSLVAAIQFTIFTMFGWPLTRTLAFPLAYLYFAVPFGQAIEPRLQAITASLAVDMLRFANVPVFADGDMIFIPTGNFSVAEECSGLRFLIASVAIGTLFAGIMYRSWSRRAAFLCMSLVLPVFANGARAFGIIWLAYATSNRLAMGVDHIVYGWIFFSIILLVMLAIGIRFRDGDDSRTTGASRLRPYSEPARATRIFLAGLMALATLSAAKLYGNRLDDLPVTGTAHLLSPVTQAPWHEAFESDDPLAPVFVGADAELHTEYTNGIMHTYLHVAYFLRGRRGAQAVSSDQNFEGGGGWTTVAAGTTAAQLQNELLSVQFKRSTRGDLGHLVWYWYWVDGQFTGNPYLAKLLETKAKLFGGERASALIAICSSYANGSSEGETALREFSSALGGLGTMMKAAPKP